MKHSLPQPLNEQDHQKLGGFRAWSIWAVAALFYLYEFLVRVAPAVMEPELQKTFHLSAGTLGLMLGAYFYIYAPAQIVVGSFFDRFGPKYLLSTSALLCAIGAFLEVLGSTAILLGVARFLQGLGSAFAFVGTVYLCTRWFPHTKLALLSGLTTSVGMIGAILGNVGIADFVGIAGWRMTLFDAAIVGVIIAALIFLVVPHQRHKPSHETLASIERGLFYALLRVLRNPQSWLVGLVANGLYMPLSALGTLWGVQYVMTLTGVSKLDASTAVSMLYVGWLFGCPAAGWLSDRLRRRRQLLLIASLLTLAATSILIFYPAPRIEVLSFLILVVGVVSSVQVISFASAVELNNPRVSGTALAFTNTIVMLIGGLMQPLMGMILDWVSVDGAYTAHAYRLSMLVMPIFALLAVLCSFFMKESSPSTFNNH